MKRARPLLLAASCLWMAGAGPGSAQGPPPLGPEFQVNSYTTGGQVTPAVAAAGDFVIVWPSYDQKAYSWGIFGQRYSPDGDPAGAEFQVNTYITGGQYAPAVAKAIGGAFVVVWESGLQDGGAFGIFGQRYAADGNPVGGEFQVNTFTPFSQSRPDVAVDSEGDFVVVWESYQDGDRTGIFGQRYDASGNQLEEEFQVNTYTSNEQSGPAVASDPAGRFVVVWQSLTQDGALHGIFGQRFDSAGIPVGQEFQVNSFTSHSQVEPDVTSDAVGSFTVVWSSDDEDGESWGVFGQRFDADGMALGGEFQVNTYTLDDQYLPSVAADAAGNFVVVWHSDADPNYGIFGQRYDSSGGPVGGEFQVNSYTTGRQLRPSVAVDSSSDLVVAWQSDQGDSSEDIFGQRYLGPLLFADGFESGDTTAWDQVER